MTTIIFDIDGTLADTKAVDDKCFIQAFLETFNIDLGQQDWAVLQNVTDWGITEEIIQTNHNRLPSTSEYQQMKSCLFEKLATTLEKDNSQFQAVDGAIAFFDFLKNETDHPVGIATGAWEQSALIKLRGIGLNHKNIPFSNSDFFKSREDILKHAIRQTREKHPDSTNDILYFGDGLWDYTTCKNLDIRFIGIDILNDGKLRKAGAEFVFPNFLDIEGIMEVINAEISKEL